MDIKTFTQLSPKEFDEIEGLAAQVFGDTYRPNKFRNSAPRKEGLISFLAYDKGLLVGYKIGYPLSPTVFYSWLGGVLPSHRGRGIATQLMEKQHLTIKEAGYQKVRTKTRANYTAMLILNLKFGFKINGTETKKEVSELIIQMEKALE